MKIIYHTPVPLDPKSPVGCGIRPVKMLQAFYDIGADVTIVAGSANERRKAINIINKNISEGVVYSFCYSEGPSLPTLLSEKHRLPLHPFLDFNFFANLKKNNIPIGLFYRDIYWLVNEHSGGWGPLKNSIANFFYRYDLRKYHELIDILYLPSMKMGDYIPYIDINKFKELPPGCEIENKFENVDKKLNLFYVGGIGNHYQMHELFKGISKTSANLCICNRVLEWENVKDEYTPYLNQNIEIVHKSGNDLDLLYKNSNIASLFLKPDNYRTFAMPIKLFEYLGKGKPIIATKGTLAGDFVEENNIGWVIDYKETDLVDLLNYLSCNFHEVKETQLRVIQLANHHTWKARAMKVSTDFMVD